jgi:hypothetical protein
MDFINRTRYAAQIITTIVEEDRMMASVIIKAMFSVDGGKLAPLEKQQWPIGQGLKTEFGTFDDETPFRKQGVDVMLLGKAYPTGGSQGNRGRVLLQAGNVSYEIDVFGTRTWVRSGDRLVASDPEPFESIPLTWEYAYGGKSPVETGELPYHSNPVGKGFYLSEEAAEGGELPNLENPQNPIKSWEDQPEPVGIAPLSRNSSLRIMNSAEFDTESKPPRIKFFKPSYFNNANPRLIMDFPVEPGTPFVAGGVLPDGGDLRFRLPKGSFHVYVQLADRPYAFPVHLDSVALFSERTSVVLGFRCCFKYRLVPLERRVAVLYSGVAPATIPTDYVIDWSEFADGEVVNA